MKIETANGAHFVEKALPAHGRQHEIAEVAALLRQPDCQLATLTGPAGIGKTSLALAIAEASDGPIAFVSFEDSAFVSAKNQAQQIERALASLDSPELPARRVQRPLLVLDSVDELADSSCVLSHLLSARPTLKVLVSSRNSLELPEEWVVKVRGLDFRQSEQNGLRLTCAAQMFVKRVRARHAGFAAFPHQRTINYICASLEGSPLGIALAADLVDSYSLPEIANRVTNDLDFLSPRCASGPARHASIRGAMDSSWKQLTKEQRDTFARVSVFDGGFSEKAAQDLAHCNRKTLASLVESYWLRLERTRTAVRYTIHPLLRRYGLEKLASATPDTDSLAIDLERSHAEFFAQLLCAQAKGLSAVDDESFYQIDLEYLNLLQAWAWLRSHCPAAELVHFVNTFQLYCIYRNHRQEAARLLESALALRTLAQEQRTRWQHLLVETRSKPERMHSAERRGLPRIGIIDNTPMRSRWLKTLAPPPGAARPNLVQLQIPGTIQD